MSAVLQFSKATAEPTQSSNGVPELIVVEPNL